MKMIRLNIQTDHFHHLSINLLTSALYQPYLLLKDTFNFEAIFSMAIWPLAAIFRYSS